MGLDMYLDGRMFLMEDWTNPEANEKLDGFRVKGKTLELGYWRKHPNLHGFIVQEFADGKDECQEIKLSKENLDKLERAVKNDALPVTQGFFFGVTDGSEKAETLEVIRKARAWLEVEAPNVIKSVIYQASW